MSAANILRELKKQASSEKAMGLSRFFKTGKGEYGEGDKFLGVMVPQTRAVARKFSALSFAEIEKLLASRYHEARLCALLILVEQFKKGNNAVKEKIFQYYLANTRYVNNWDLVDLSAGKIVGAHLWSRPKSFLSALARSESLWERRIAMIASSYYIINNRFQEPLRIAKMLLQDRHDLIHKAVGWMLREVGKRDIKVLEKFLDQNVGRMPRTTLRYAIERLPDSKRKYYLKL